MTGHWQRLNSWLLLSPGRNKIRSLLDPGFLSQPPLSVSEAYDPGTYRSARSRPVGFLLALLAEALLVLLVLTLGTSLTQHQRPGEIIDVVRFRASSEQEQAAKAPEPTPEPAKERPKPQPQKTTEVEPKETPPIPVPKQQPKPKIIIPSPVQTPAPNIAPVRPASPPAPNAPQFGPVNRGPAGAGADTPRVSGAGPNGEPLYAAAWYREPSHDELSGYLSTANGPGWGLIACRTVPDYHVDDCVLLDEYPTGSNIGRAVLAAAWQFQVRPPRVGGRSMVGEWVRIKIIQDVRQR